MVDGFAWRVQYAILFTHLLLGIFFCRAAVEVDIITFVDILINIKTVYGKAR